MSVGNEETQVTIINSSEDAKPLTANLKVISYSQGKNPISATASNGDLKTSCKGTYPSIDMGILVNMTKKALTNTSPNSVYTST